MYLEGIHTFIVIEKQPVKTSDKESVNLGIDMALYV